MITDDEIVRLFKLTDPARDGGEARRIDATGYLAALRTRSYDMQLIDSTEAPTERPRASRWMPAGIAAAIVLIVAGAVILTRDDGEDEVRSVPPTTVAPVEQATTVAPVEQATTGDENAARSAEGALALVRSYYDAINGYDADLAMSLLTDEAIVAAWGSPEDFQAELGSLEAYGAHTTLGECAPAESQGAAITIRCSYEFQDLGSEELGLGPFAGSSAELVVEDGIITSITDNLEVMTNGYSEQVWEPFRAWIVAKHPDDVAIIYTDSRSFFRTTEESNRLIQERLPQYVAARLTAERVAAEFLDAYGSNDATSAGAYLADSAATEGISSDEALDYTQAIAFHQAVGFEQQVGACRQMRVAASAIEVECPFAYQMRAPAELGLGPFEGGFYEITVDDETGMITKVTSRWVQYQYMQGFGNPFQEWVATTHPEDAEVMFDDDDDPAITPESLALWAEHSDAYVQHVLSGTPPATTA